MSALRFDCRQQGQSMTEYLVILAIVIALLISQPSVIDFFLASVQLAFNRFSGFISLPL